MNHARMFIVLIALLGALAIHAASHHREVMISAAAEIPKTWDEAALAEWATPVAGLNVRPTNISAKEYYAMTVENLRSYPVYFPGREPEGYWEMLERVGPQPLIEPEKLKNEADWSEAGRRVFEEADHLHLRTLDPKLVAAARSLETFKNAEPLADGTVPSMRWVPTKNGVALSFSNCSNCHVLPLPDGARISGAPGFGTGSPSPQDRSRGMGRTVSALVV